VLQITAATINYDAGNCCMAMQPENTGAQLMTCGITAYFKPWYFDGSTVYWGEPELTRSDAEESASKIKQSMLSKSKRGGFVNNW
jgi:hypothetical protein